MYENNAIFMDNAFTVYKKPINPDSNSNTYKILLSNALINQINVV